MSRNAVPTFVDTFRSVTNVQLPVGTLTPPAASTTQPLPENVRPATGMLVAAEVARGTPGTNSKKPVAVPACGLFCVMGSTTAAVFRVASPALSV